MVYTVEYMDELKKQMKDVIDILGFMKSHMATNDDLEELRADMVTHADLKTALQPIDDRLHAVEQKLDGINRRLDGEAMQRQELKIPDRVKRIEQHLGMDRTISA